MKFIAIVWPAFLARVNPVSAMANPACMNMTRKPQTRVHTMLMATLAVPDGVRDLRGERLLCAHRLDVVVGRGSGGHAVDVRDSPRVDARRVGHGGRCRRRGRRRGGGVVPRFRLVRRHRRQDRAGDEHERRKAQHPFRPLPQISGHHVLLLLFRPIREGRAGVEISPSAVYGKLMSTCSVTVFCPPVLFSL